ncbi:hypothetical protein [Granulicella sp. L46]|uniref:hypothetical protein n=1 Tax=Granulicella sp. L46 TaxID=1641865 RepID=UPI00131D3BFF|nr:hypothetical protein [Granulicella sp. L46]
MVSLRLRVAWATGVCVLAGAAAASAQTPAQVEPPTMMSATELPAGTPLSWAQDAIRNEIKVIESSDKLPLRYRQRRVGAKGDLTREIIASRDGNVGRLVERDGQPITAAEDADERERLNDLISSPDDFYRHHRKDLETRESVIKVVGLMPEAMLYSYAPGQPQLKGSQGEVVLDFRPNPSFHPPTMFAECLTGLEGRVWIDPRTRTLSRIEARVLRPVNMGFGILAKIYPGGTLALDQVNVGDDHWVYSHLDEHVTARVLMVKNYPENTVITSWDFRPMPSLLSYQDGIRMLLAMPVATK